MNGVVRRQIHTEGRSDGSRTQTIHDVPTTGEGGALAGPSTGGAQSEPQGVLRLRGGHSSARRVVWTEDTVDNEGLGRKKSKICCIYHKPKAFDESSSDESSSSSGSSSESDSDSASSADDDGPSMSQSMKEKRAEKRRSKGSSQERHSGSDHEHNYNCDGEHTHSKSKKTKRKLKSGGTRMGGSSTMTVTEQPDDEESVLKKNAYERGPR